MQRPIAAPNSDVSLVGSTTTPSTKATFRAIVDNIGGAMSVRQCNHVKWFYPSETFYRRRP